jgi:hypothetical protein
MAASFSEMAALIDHANRRGLRLSVWAFFDDSGKYHDKDFICLCGFLSDTISWNNFQNEWLSLLRCHDLMPGIHMTNFFYRCKVKGWKEDRANHVLSQFIDVIVKNVQVAFGVGMDAKHYREMPPEAKKRIDDPMLLCIQRALALLRKEMATEPAERLMVVIDEDRESSIKQYSNFHQLRKTHDDLRKFIGGIGFADDEWLVQLQAADILANLTTRWYQSKLAGAEVIPPHLSQILNPTEPGSVRYKDEFWNGRMLDREWRNAQTWPTTAT